MMTPPRWVRDRIHGLKCVACQQPMTSYAVRECHFRLVPRSDESGYGAMIPYLATCCANCGHERLIEARGVQPAMLKKAIAWLIDRTQRRTNPITGEIVTPPEMMDPADPSDAGGGDQEGDTATADPDSPPDAPPGSPPDAETPEFDRPDAGSPDHAGEEDPPPFPLGSPSKRKRVARLAAHRCKFPNSGRRLTTPSIRSCCPPDPLGKHAVSAARRQMRCYSDRRDAPSYPRFMKKFGVRLDTDGNTVEPE